MSRKGIETKSGISIMRVPIVSDVAQRAANDREVGKVGTRRRMS